MTDLSSSDEFKYLREPSAEANHYTNDSDKEKVCSECSGFIFHSGRHQRYESGKPTMGVQVCARTINVEKNINGCSGYRLLPCDGYIVRMINDDLCRDQMSPKPMRVVSASEDQVELRGYRVEAMTPFGWQWFDLSDYALTVYIDKGSVVKCVLHMLENNVDLEYDM